MSRSSWRPGVPKWTNGRMPLLKPNVNNRNIPNSGLGERIARSENQGVQMKILSAQSLRQVKVIRAELAKEKEASAAASKTSGGDDYFNFSVGRGAYSETGFAVC